MTIKINLPGPPTQTEDLTVSDELIVDGYRIDTRNSSTGDVLTYNGSAYVPTATAPGGVTSVNPTDASLTISPTTGAVFAAINTGHSNTWSTTQTFSDHIVVDGYTINISGGAVTSQVLKYNGSSFIAANESGAVTSVSNDDGTITASPTTGAVIVKLPAVGTAGSFGVGNGSITFDAYGRETARTDPSNIVLTSRLINTTAPLTGGGDLSANRTFGITQSSGSTNGYLSSTDWNTFNNKIGGSGTSNQLSYFSGSGTITSSSNFTISGSNLTVVGHLGFDGYTLNASGGAVSGQVLAYNGSAFIPTTPTSGVSGSGVSGRVAFWNGTSSLTSDADFTYDSTTNILTIGPPGQLNANFISASDGTSVMIIGGNITSAAIRVGNTSRSGSSTDLWQLAPTGSLVIRAGASAATTISTLTSAGALTIASHFTFDGYTLDASGGATSGQVLAYNGSAFVPTAASGAVSSVSNSDGTLTISPTTGAVVASLALGHANTWTGAQTFNTAAVIFGAGATATGSSSFDLSGSSGTFKTSTGASTFGGSSNTMTNALAISATTNQLVLGTTNTITLTSPAPSASRVITIPDPGAADTFALLGLAQTITGVKTFSAKPVFQSHIQVDGYDIDISAGATTNQVLQYNGTKFLAATISAGSGTVTSVATDATLTGGPITTTGTLGINLANANTWTGQQTFNSAAVIFGAGATATGSSSFDLSGSSGTFKTSTGASTFGGSSNTFTNAITVQPTSNQIVLGVTRTITLTAPTPASSSRTLTMPDPGADDSFVYLALGQVLTNKTLTTPIINGATSASGNFDLSGSSGTFKTTTGASTFGGSSNTMTNALTISATTNQLTLGTTNTSTITAPAPASSRTITLADMGANTRIVQNAANASETQLTTTGATDVISFTPAAAGNFIAYIYYRVVTGATNLTLNVTYTDATGAQTAVVVPSAQSQATGSYVMAPVFFNATAAAIKVTATAGTANNIYVSAAVVGI